MQFFLKNEKYCACSIKILLSFTSEKAKFNAVRNTYKVQLLLSLKDKVQHLNYVIYKGICSCGETYVAETIRNCKIRWNEHNDVNASSEHAKHLAKNIDHKFSWYILTSAPENTLKRRILEAYFIKLIFPSLKEKLDNGMLMLFQNDVT